jgi:hypothetical protein
MLEVSWKSETLKKGRYMIDQRGDITLQIDHPGRIIDPYMVGVFYQGRLVYSGLHPTLSDARRECERQFKALS